MYMQNIVVWPYKMWHSVCHAVCYTHYTNATHKHTYTTYTCINVHCSNKYRSGIVVYINLRRVFWFLLFSLHLIHVSMYRRKAEKKKISNKNEYNLLRTLNTWKWDEIYWCYKCFDHLIVSIDAVIWCIGISGKCADKLPCCRIKCNIHSFLLLLSVWYHIFTINPHFNGVRKHLYHWSLRMGYMWSVWYWLWIVAQFLTHTTCADAQCTVHTCSFKWRKYNTQYISAILYIRKQFISKRSMCRFIEWNINSNVIDLMRTHDRINQLKFPNTHRPRVFTFFLCNIRFHRTPLLL